MATAHLAFELAVVADVIKRWNELLKVMAAKETQMILMPQTASAPGAAATE